MPDSGIDISQLFRYKIGRLGCRNRILRYIIYSLNEEKNNTGGLMNWKEQIQNSYIRISDLSACGFSKREMVKLETVIQRHPMKITPYYFSLIDCNDADDPIKKMSVPLADELDRAGSYDTSGEAQSTVFEGAQHKYAATLLLLCSNRCATYCRFCFRKRMVGLPEKEVLRRFDLAKDYITAHSEIRNVLLSGGDPLILKTEIINDLLNKFGDLEQLTYIRIGSRIPATLPQRITEDDSLLQVLSDYNRRRKRLYIVTHFNHPRELSSEAVQSLQALSEAGIIMSNQTVLLKGVNDNVDVMTELMEKLVRNRVMPYYIFQCRPVRGIRQTFQVPLVEGIEIIERVRERLDGICKRFRFIMSANQGKIEILGKKKGIILMKMHQAREAKFYNKIFSLSANTWGTWIDDFKQVSIKF